MKVLLSWLREFVDVPGTAHDIADTMSVRGFAVEGLEPLGADDAVIDFEVTGNRPDCMSIGGMAREVATAYGLHVRRPAVSGRSDALDPNQPPLAKAEGPRLHLTSLKSVEKSDIAVVIESPALCPRYAGAVADVAVGPSPEWMQERLRSTGVRPINNIVDVTNYVLLELGQPMHAFDFAKLEGAQIRVRTARAGETLRTLDGQSRELNPDMLVIADAERATAIAGVMGGADSEVSSATTTIVFESAYFNPRSVRRTSKLLGLKTEASMRFERGADPRLPVTAMERACALLETIGAGRARGVVVDCYPSRVEPVVVHLRRQKIEGLLGLGVPDAEVTRILDALGFALRDVADGWDVTVPTRRVDVAREVDLIEEVARHRGFDAIPTTFPVLTAAARPIDPRITQTRQLRGVMTGAGFSEAMTFGFMAEPAAARFAAEGDLVPIRNPLSDNFAVLRPSALPGLLDALAYNRRRERRDVRLFEVGSCFSRAGGERRTLACVWTGSAGAEHWGGNASEVDFFDMKGIVERIFESLRMEIRAEPHPEVWLVPGRAAAVLANGTRLGVLGLLDPHVAEQHDLPRGDAVYVAEIDLDAINSSARSGDIRVEPLPRYPSVTRDLSILVADTLSAAEVRQTVRETAPSTLVQVREFDRYQGKGIPDGKVSLSIRLTFRSLDRTLTDDEVQGAMERVVTALKDRHGAIQR